MNRPSKNVIHWGRKASVKNKFIKSRFSQAGYSDESLLLVPFTAKRKLNQTQLTDIQNIIYGKATRGAGIIGSSYGRTTYTLKRVIHFLTKGTGVLVVQASTYIGE